MRQTHLKPSFVEFIPNHLEDGVLYISERFRTCSHNCCCGCGEEVVLPLSPAEWQLSRDGDAVSIWPSVGNWDYACKSHYVIRWNQVRWAGSQGEGHLSRRSGDDLRTHRQRRRAAKAAGHPQRRCPNAFSFKLHPAKSSEGRG